MANWTDESKKADFQKFEKLAEVFSSDFGSDDFNAIIYSWGDHAVWRLIDWRVRPGNAYGDTIYDFEGSTVSPLDRAKVEAEVKFDELTKQQQIDFPVEEN